MTQQQADQIAAELNARMPMSMVLMSEPADHMAASVLSVVSRIKTMAVVSDEFQVNAQPESWDRVAEELERQMFDEIMSKYPEKIDELVKKRAGERERKLLHLLYTKSNIMQAEVEEALRG